MSAEFPPVTADPSGESGEVLAAGPVNLPFKYIAARELATWLIASVEKNLTGTFNILSPVGHSTMSALLGANKTTPIQMRNSSGWQYERLVVNPKRTRKWRRGSFISRQINLPEHRQRKFR